MKIFSVFCLIFLAFACKQVSDKTENVIFKPRDKEILERIFDLNINDRKATNGTLMVKIGFYLEETPYVAHTLEPDSSEQLVINLRELDCTTFAENCLAITRALKSGDPSWERFIAELKKIRYRNGKLGTYTSRLHYFSDWIFDNNEKKIIKDMGQEIAQTIYVNKVNFMSTHPGSYRQLKDNPGFIEEIKKQEEKISSRIAYYIPEEKIKNIESLLMDGDIVGITTNIKGLDISHVGILIRKGGSMHLMHASSAAKKVVVSANTLEEYLLNSKSATGIMVARPF